jgi:hypothetical protein
MKQTTPYLDGISVARPCPASWEEMKGDDRVRHCGGCRMNVYNLSAMSRRDAEDLVRKTEGRLCVRFYRRTDGTVLTQDCPVGLRAFRRRVALFSSALAAMLLGMFAAGCGRAPSPGDGGAKPPADGGGRGTTGIVAPPAVMGDVADPPVLQGEVFVPPPVPPR